jgi:hypothetical protein
MTQVSQQAVWKRSFEKSLQVNGPGKRPGESSFSSEKTATTSLCELCFQTKLVETRYVLLRNYEFTPRLVD